MSKVHIALSSIKGSEITMESNSNEKTNGLNYMKQMNKNKYVAHTSKQTTTTKLQAPDLGQAHTVFFLIKVVQTIDM